MRGNNENNFVLSYQEDEPAKKGGIISYLMIDGKLIETSEYTISGSETDAVLTADLLKRLGEGGHTIMFVYDDGWASGTFSVVADHHDSKEESSIDNKSNTDNGERSPSKSSSPQTGDTTADGMPVCALLIMLSLAGIVFGQAKDQRFKFIERECP